MISSSLRWSPRGRLLTVLAAVVTALATVASTVLPATPARADFGISCGFLTTTDGWRNCETWLNGDREINDIEPYFAWVHLGDKVSYKKQATTNNVGRIFVSGNSSSCSGYGITDDTPVKVTQIDTFTFSTIGFGFTVNPSTSSGTINVTAGGTSVSFTNVHDRGSCVQHNYGIEFLPTGLGVVWSMAHSTTTTFDWGGGRSWTVGTYDTTRFPGV
ncbi:hypothetical protein MRQ36_03010 [Micromonospora sp. R77]|uniref:hypothetical protein n=1 Tax=Micromonospora sp. R77 TaxID=2925836 RepID=UPI001F6058EE|nr:hypothetical protein [Micromonospora sp. R77]MCI4061597.1 hypothetical protein [Micromonospora sp. R77]